MSALRCLAFASLLAVTAAVQAAPATYTLDPDHTQVQLTWNHFGYSNPSANIGLGSGTLEFDPAHPERASVQVSLPLGTLDTHVPALDSHLQQTDFFDAARFPQATFKSTRVQALGGHKFKIHGELTVHGVTRPIVLDATLNRVGVHPMTKLQSIGFDATTQLKRSDFGVGAYVPDVSDEVRVHITTEGAVAAAAKP
jgi:polyisoprenoid-binding protein YceI